MTGVQTCALPIYNFKEKVTSRVEGHTGPIDPDLVTVRSSRKNNYISVNITIAATGEEQLSEIFEDLKKIKSVTNLISTFNSKLLNNFWMINCNTLI